MLSLQMCGMSVMDKKKHPGGHTGCHIPPSASSPRVLLRTRFCPSNAPSSSLPNLYFWKLYVIAYNSVFSPEIQD